MSFEHNDPTLPPEKKPLSHKIQQTIASLRLEGMSLSDADIHDLQEIEAGRLSKKEYLARALERAKSTNK